MLKQTPRPAVAQPRHDGLRAPVLRLDPLGAALGQDAELLDAEEPLSIGEDLVEHGELCPVRAADVAVAAAGAVRDVRLDDVGLVRGLGQPELLGALHELLGAALEVLARRSLDLDELARRQEGLRKSWRVEAGSPRPPGPPHSLRRGGEAL